MSAVKPKPQPLEAIDFLQALLEDKQLKMDLTVGRMVDASLDVLRALALLDVATRENEAAMKQAEN